MVKQEVLAALDAVRGRYISGQELAAQLGVSRTAVWKAVAALRRDGIPIKAVTNRGYTLAQSVDVLNAAAVAVQLDEATVKALQIEVVDRLPGTNAALRSREHGKWQGFYANECLTDVKHTAWLLRDLMGCLRNQGDGPYFYTWQRQVLYTPAQARVVLITNMENHLDDLALYEAMKQKKLQQP